MIRVNYAVAGMRYDCRICAADFPFRVGVVRLDNSFEAIPSEEGIREEALKTAFSMLRVLCSPWSGLCVSGRALARYVAVLCAQTYACEDEAILPEDWYGRMVRRMSGYINTAAINWDDPQWQVYREVCVVWQHDRRIKKRPRITVAAA